MDKDLISVYDIKDDMAEILDLAIKIKKDPKKYARTLKDKSLGMIFEKPSTRTRISFEVAMTQLGGHALYLSPKDMQMGRGETVADTAKVLSRFVDGITYRAFDHNMVLELAKNATIPVINALDNLEHPAQIVADLLTILEKKGSFKNLKFAYVGDGNNVANSLILGCAVVHMDCYIGCPASNKPNAEILKIAKDIAGDKSKIEIVEDPVEAVKDADVIYTDVWVSMGEEAQKEEKEKLFRPYQVNTELVKHAKKDYIFMHCLPAHRGYEVTDEVVDSKNSVVFDEAENRLHAQKALLVKMLK
jgi:ornithine carbamoyltransferase